MNSHRLPKLGKKVNDVRTSVLYALRGRPIALIAYQSHLFWKILPQTISSKSVLLTQSSRLRFSNADRTKPIALSQSHWANRTLQTSVTMFASLFAKYYSVNCKMEITGSLLVAATPVACDCGKALNCSGLFEFRFGNLINSFAQITMFVKLYKC